VNLVEPAAVAVGLARELAPARNARAVGPSQQGSMPLRRSSHRATGRSPQRGEGVSVPTRLRMGRWRHAQADHGVKG
jgi:hypothetical protein